jgi:hypothetical protein
MRQTHRRRDPRRAESGFSVVEVLLLTVPLCVLSMVAASKLAATSSAKAKARVAASLASQQSARNLCGGSASLNGPWQSPASAQAVGNLKNSTITKILQQGIDANGKLQTTTNTGDVASVLSHVSKVGTIISSIGTSMAGLSKLIEARGTFPEDLLQHQDLTNTNWSASATSASVAAYYFKPLADKMMPDPTTSLPGSAAFICHEPDSAESPSDKLHVDLLVFAFDEAANFY